MSGKRSSCMHIYAVINRMGMGLSYDCIVVDTPPALGILTVNVLTACRAQEQACSAADDAITA